MIAGTLWLSRRSKGLDGTLNRLSRGPREAARRLATRICAVEVGAICSVTTVRGGGPTEECLGGHVAVMATLASLAAPRAAVPHSASPPPGFARRAVHEPTRRNLLASVLLVCVAAFVLGLMHLFKLRFDVGDVYPKYSSLRADPLGTMAFYESLERMPYIFVRRDFSTGNQMPHGKETTYLHLGARTSDWRRVDEEVIKEIEGYREVIGLKKELSRLSWQIYTQNEILGRKNNAVMALIKL